MMQLYEKYVISVHEEVKSVIRHYPFKNIEEISLLLEAEGFPFEEYGLGTLESVLQEIPEVAYIEGGRYYIPLAEVEGSPYAAEEEMVIEEDGEERLLIEEEENREEEMDEMDVSSGTSTTNVRDSGWEDDEYTDVDDLIFDDLGWEGSTICVPTTLEDIIATPTVNFNNKNDS
ncbi:hypothetical protein ABEB36_015062 [Hypothenemus hampei]|uniref:Uncharacterized protein n=1 Tax=Hypothenemus hampei TaxID=57062 RepID=A0ABD1E316_HYPHA